MKRKPSVQHDELKKGEDPKKAAEKYAYTNKGVKDERSWWIDVHEGFLAGVRWERARRRREGA